MPTITIDDEVFGALQSQAKPFVDTPNSVLRRLLGLDEGDEPRKFAIRIGPAVRRAPKGAALAQADYEIPILKVLDRLGGQAPRDSALRELEREVNDQLGDLDRAPLESGAIRWEKTASWAVKNMKTRGLIEPTEKAGWGIWAISEAGRRRLHESTRKGR